MKKKLLLTARDYSSAINAFALSRSLLLSANFNIRVALGYPAICLFHKHYPNKLDEFIEFLDFFPKHSERKGDIFKSVKNLEKIVHQEKPDILITGISGEGIGVDEIATKVCKNKIPVLAYQDFWGYINPGIDCIADRVLLMDWAAEFETRKHYSNLRCDVVGSLKYDYYLNHVVSDLSLKMQSSAPSMGDNFWVFIGQPLAFLDSYLNMLNLVLGLARQRNVLCYYLPHPSEQNHRIKSYLPPGFLLADEKKTPKEILLLKSKKVLTAFSTYVTDVLILKKIMKLNKPDIAVINTSKEIHDYRSSFPGSLTHFPISEELVFNVKEKSDLEKFLTRKRPRYDMINFKSALQNIFDILLGI